MPYTEDPGDLAGCDAAVVGAPMDELASDRPGTRMGPRAIRAESTDTGGHLEAGVDWNADLTVVDYGDAAVVPADPAASHRGIESIVSEVRRSGTIPLILGGDHSITEPCLRGCASEGPLGLIHFDAHTDTASELWGVEVSHGTPMRRLVEQGHVDARRYAQIGLRGYWPGEPEFAWQESVGITSFFMHDVRELGIAAVVERTMEIVGDGPVYLTVDIDSLDPAFAPGTGTPEPGGMNVHELLSACRRVADAVELIGADVVEVLPARSGPVDVTALMAGRIVSEILTGLALRRGRRSAGG
ncbi:MAG TPA: agmatinase [Solirubrobacterales bacterium]|nr:agmatinase [Solirubrobacterales bacterium]